MKNNRQELNEWIITILTAIVLVIVIRTFILDSRVVPTPSMVPTIEPWDRLFVEKVTHRFKGLERVIVLFHRNNWLKDDLIKRLIALPGDTVEIKGGKVYVNDEPLDEPYLAEPMHYEYPLIQVPEGKIFVLGDNRNRSYDSHEWGFADLESVKGKALFTYWPLNRMKYWK